jgi:hypothetical protein
MPEYETISKRLEKLQVSFSRKLERMGYDGKHIGSAGWIPAARMVQDHIGVSGQRTEQQGVLRAAWDFRENILLLAAETAADCGSVYLATSVGEVGGKR